MALDSLRDMIFGKPITPEESVKKWRAELRKEIRQLDRNVVRTCSTYSGLAQEIAFGSIFSIHSRQLRPCTFKCLAIMGDASLARPCFRLAWDILTASCVVCRY